MVVWVDDLVFPALLAQELQCPVCNDLVRIHVGGGSRSSLDGIDGELVMQFAGNDLIARFDDGSPYRWIENTILKVRQGSSLLDVSQSLNEEGKPGYRNIRHHEVLHGPNSLHPIIGV